MQVQHIATPTATQLGAAAMNDDVVAEILLRLPAKSVLRCRAVCRSWRRITTADYFVAAHSRRRPLQLLGYTGPNDESLRDDEFLVTSAPVTAVPAVYDGTTRSAGDFCGATCACASVDPATGSCCSSR